MKEFTRGFTLIELMIVVAIVGILAAIALPQYSEYIARSKVSESLAFLSSTKPSIQEYVSTNGQLPDDMVHAGINSPTAADTKYTKDMTYTVISHFEQARVSATLQNVLPAVLDDKHVWLNILIDTDSQLIWDCGTDVDQSAWKYLPSNCRSSF